MFWEDIELYLNVRYQWIKKLKFQKTMKIEENDIVDLWNMVFVNKNCLYWTNDAKWINLIKEARMEKYLFKE